MPLALDSDWKPRSWQPSGRAARIPFAKQPGAMGFRWSKQDSSLLRARAFSSAGTTVELRRMLQEYIETGPGSRFKQGNIELDLVAFTDLIDNVAPGMGRQEIKALFTSMDTSNDNAIQTEEVFCELTLSILLNRMNAVVNHPLEGSYHCLPCPPFHPDAKQLDAIKVLIKNFDEVVAAQSQPIPPMQLPPLPSKAVSARAQGSLGMFSSLFGGVSKRNGTEKAEEKPKQKPIEFVPTPCAPKGAYLYGGNGCGKTVLLDLFFRSLPEGVSARRLHWQENMGRADYSALVERYHTIFIEAVPKFKPDLGAEFQRFVLAIDILYGKKVSLYLQSEVPARNLFSDSSSVTEFNLDLRMAFRRCSSMLAEMQSPKYQHIVWLMRNHMLQETAMRL